MSHDSWLTLTLFAFIVMPWIWRRIVHIRGVMRKYFDGIYAILRVLDLPLDDWEKKYRIMTYGDAEWFGFQRGYTRGLLDALEFLSYKEQPPLHTNRLEPTPPE